MVLSLRRRLKQESADLGTNEHALFNFIFEGKNSFLLGLLELHTLAKGVVDTFKPYKSKFYVISDAGQLLHGIGNLIRAGQLAAAAITRFALTIIKCIFYDLFFKAGPVTCLKNLFKSAINDLLGGLFHAAATALRGAIQVATAPLTWLIRMPIRFAIYIKSNWGAYYGWDFRFV
jgi:hypothetical protein